MLTIVSVEFVHFLVLAVRGVQVVTRHSVELRIAVADVAVDVGQQVVPFVRSCQEFSLVAPVVTNYTQEMALHVFYDDQYVHAGEAHASVSE